MSSRNYPVALVALVMSGAGVWWVLSGRDSQQSKDPSALPSAGNPVQQANPAPPIPQAAVIVESNSAGTRTDEAPRNAGAPPSPVVWPAQIIQFADRADPDPALSREIEYAIQRSLTTRLDPNRNEAPSIKCRGLSCQILLVDRATPGARVPPTAVSMMLRDLSEASIRNPGTGVQIGQPMLEEVMQISFGEYEGIVTVLAFQKP